MLEVLILTIVLVLIAVLLLGIRVFFVKGGRFPNTHIEGNKALRQQGIHCAASMDRDERRQTTTNKNKNNNPDYEKD